MQGQCRIGTRWRVCDSWEVEALLPPLRLTGQSSWSVCLDQESAEDLVGLCLIRVGMWKPTLDLDRRTFTLHVF